MKFNLLHVCTLLCTLLSVAVVGGSYGAVTPEVYWKSVLPKSPMPKSIKDILYTSADWNKGKPFYSDASLVDSDKIRYAAKPFYLDASLVDSDKIRYAAKPFYLDASLVESDKIHYAAEPFYLDASLVESDKIHYAAKPLYLDASLVDSDKIRYAAKPFHLDASLVDSDKIHYAAKPFHLDASLVDSDKIRYATKPFYLDASLVDSDKIRYAAKAFNYLEASLVDSAKLFYAAKDTQLKDDANVVLFFIENDLHQGTEMNLLFTKSDHKSTFLPRKMADSIPFSSNELPLIYNKLSVNPDSVEAEIMKQTLTECEGKNMEGEEKYCATSLESMVDFSTTQLGKHVKAISTEVNAKESIPLQMYKMGVVKKLAANKAVVCHKRNYPYAVFYCHIIVGSQAYKVSLTGVDGTKVNAIVMCHTDTSKWDPKHVAFQMLKVKPGTVPICHFVAEAQVVWVPYQ